jgi:uncharacterized UPF0160 family protein
MMKRSLTKLIGTHSGSFHCDEALAIAMLKRLPEWADASVVRTRDEATLAQCDLVVDVGSVYDAERLRFDHHQRGFETFFDGRATAKLSSAGLVFKHFGRRIVAAHLNKPDDEPLVDLVWRRLYVSFIEAVDAIDNGVARFDTTLLPRYEAHTDLASRVGQLNASWLEQLTDAETDLRFASAVALTGTEFDTHLNLVVHQWLPARAIVDQAVADRFALDEGGRIIRLSRYCPWQQHIFEIAGTEQILYVLYDEADGKQCRVAAVAIGAGSFSSRKALPAPWRGLRDGELDRVTQIPGGVFVHANGFIGGAKDGATALAMARAAAAWTEQQNQ